MRSSRIRNTIAVAVALLAGVVAALTVGCSAASAGPVEGAVERSTFRSVAGLREGDSRREVEARFGVPEQVVAREHLDILSYAGGGLQVTVNHANGRVRYVAVDAAAAAFVHHFGPDDTLESLLGKSAAEVERRLGPPMTRGLPNVLAYRLGGRFDDSFIEFSCESGQDGACRHAYVHWR